MATFEEKAERLKKELEEATNDDQRRNLSREYELTLRLLRIIRGEDATISRIRSSHNGRIGNPAGCGGNPQVLRKEILSSALQISDPH